MMHEWGNKAVAKATQSKKEGILGRSLILLANCSAGHVHVHVLANVSEAISHLIDEDLGLLPCSKVSASIHFSPMHDIRPI